MGSVLGTILDPAADKALMTTLTVTLAIKGLLPRTLFTLTNQHGKFHRLSRGHDLSVPLAVIILGRDILLSLAAFIIRYRTLPPPVSIPTSVRLD